MYLNSDQWHNWKYAPFLYHLSWWLIFLILIYFALLLPELAPSLALFLRPWPMLALILLSGCLLIVYLQGKRQKQRNMAKSDVIVAQATALQAAEAKIDYLLRIIHDMRSPLTAILNALPLLESKTSTNGYLQGIKSACHHIVGLASKVLGQAAATQGKLNEPRPEPVMLSAWLQEIVAICFPSAAKKRVTLTVEADPELPDYISIDREAVTRMILNLTDNAIFYSPSGKEVKIRVIPDLPHFIIEVINETTKKLPDNLFTAYVSGGGRKAAAGLGLSITRNLAEQMGGTAYLVQIPESNKAAFNLQLPLVTTSGPMPQKFSEHDWPMVTEVKGNGLQVMLVDDDDNLRPILADYLLSSGIATKVTSVSSGKQAMHYAPMVMPDVIITDDRLIDISGVKLVEEFKRMARTAGIPVMVITGGELHPYVKESYRLYGVTEFLNKPFNIRHLGRAIERATNATD